MNRTIARASSCCCLVLTLAACGSQESKGGGSGGSPSSGGSAPTGGVSGASGTSGQSTGGSGGSAGSGVSGTAGAATGGTSGTDAGGSGGSATGGSGTGGVMGGSGGSDSGLGGSGAAGGSPPLGGAGGSGGAGTAGAGGPGGAAVTGLPAKSAVLDALRRANTYFVGRWPDPTIDIVTDRARPSNLWTRAVYYEGLMGLYAIEPDTTRKTSYYDYAVRWGASSGHPWQVAYGDPNSVDADYQACGQTYIDLYLVEQQAVRIAQIQASIDHMISTNNTTAWTWIDAIQMSMPVFAKLGALTGDAKYYNAMWGLYANSRDTQGGGLLNDANGLWWRDADYNPGGTYTRSPNMSDIYWSRGNGWVMAALVRVLDAIPANETHRATYLADFRAMAATLIPLQRSDGFWNESLTNPMHCQSVGKTGQDGPETSGTALFAYGMAWGIRKGVLDAATYGPIVVKAWNGLAQTALQSNGMLGWVQSTGAEPCDPDDTTGLGATVRPNFDDYGVGCFLLAGSAVYGLAP
ncbi:MAG TPA: glycoside hydrolase family 88 protein [Polyangiaceae bacterium]